MDTVRRHRPEKSSEGPYTWDDFIALPDDDRRELIDGHLIEVEVPNQIHEHIVFLLTTLIGGWARANKAGHGYSSGFKVQINRKRGVMPDIQFYRKGHRPKNAEQGVVGDHPDLAVEVVSPSSKGRDRVTKLNSYAKIGVPEYWIVDPEAKSLERFILKAGSYTVEAHEGNEVFKPRGFPGLAIPLAELWEIPGT